MQQLDLVVGAAVGQSTFGVRPRRLHGIELRRVGRQGLQVQTSVTTAQISNWLATVNTGVVPNHDDVPPKVTQHMTQKGGDIGAEDVLLAKMEVQTEPSSFWAD